MSQINFNVNDLTFGQTEFLSDQTGYEVGELMERLQTGQFRGGDIVAILAVCQSPDDPAAGMDDVRKMKISEVELVLSGVDETDTETDTE